MGLLNLPDEQNPRQHLGHDVESDGHGGVPHRAVRDAAALGHWVEDVAPVLDALRTESTKQEDAGRLLASLQLTVPVSRAVMRFARQAAGMRTVIGVPSMGSVIGACASIG